MRVLKQQSCLWSMHTCYLSISRYKPAASEESYKKGYLQHNTYLSNLVTHAFLLQITGPLERILKITVICERWKMGGQLLQSCSMPAPSSKDSMVNLNPKTTLDVKKITVMCHQVEITVKMLPMTQLKKRKQMVNCVVVGYMLLRVSKRFYMADPFTNRLYIQSKMSKIIPQIRAKKRK